VIVARNFEGGICIDMKLPCLDVRSVRVKMQHTTREICITAQPHLEAIHSLLKSLPNDMRGEILTITLDLKIIGKDGCRGDDIQTTYNTDTGVCSVVVRNAYLKE
jgi:hypothetical protein